MARYMWVTIPITALTAVGVWVCADIATEPSPPELGPMVRITPTGSPEDSATPQPTTKPTEEGATAVPPAPPGQAGTTDHNADDDLADDDDGYDEDDYDEDDDRDD